MAALREDVIKITFEVENDPLSAISSALDSITSGAGRAVSEVENAADKAIKKTADTVTAAEDAAGAAGETASGAMDTLTSAADTAKDSMEEVTETVTAGAEALEGEYVYALNYFGDTAEAAAQRSENAFSKFIRDFGQGFREGFQEVTGGLSIMDILKEKASQTGAAIKNKALSALSALSSKLKALPKAALNAMISGMKKLGSAALTAAKNVAAIAVKGAVTGIASLGAATAGMVAMAKGVADEGDRIDKMSQKIGISAEAYQKWDYVMARAGTDVESLKMGMKTLSSQAEKGSKAFQELGISTQELKTLSQEQLLQRTIEGLAGMEEGTKRTALASELLGRAGADLGPLLNEGTEEIQKQMAMCDEYGMIMSNDMVAASAVFEDSLTTLQKTMGGLRSRALGQFLPAMTKVTDGLAHLFTGDMSGLDEIEDGIAGILDNVEKTLPKAVEAGGKIITAIGKAIVSKGPQLLATGARIVSDVAGGILQQLPVLLPLGVQAAADFISGAVAQLPSALAVGWGMVQNILNGIIPLIPTLIPQGVQAVLTFAQGAVSMLPSVLTTGINIIRAIGTGIVNALPLVIEQGPKIIHDLISSVVAALPELGKAIFDGIVGILTNLPELITGAVKGIGGGIIDGIKSWFSPESVDQSATGQTAAESLASGYTAAAPQIETAAAASAENLGTAFASSAAPQMETAAETSMEAFNAGFDALAATSMAGLAADTSGLLGAGFDTSMMPVMQTAGTDGASKLSESFSNGMNGSGRQQMVSTSQQAADAVRAVFEAIDLSYAGRMAAEGFARGLESARGTLIAQAEALARDVENTVNKGLKVNSPSKVAMQTGRFFGRGLALGLEKTRPEVQLAASDMAGVVRGYADPVRGTGNTTTVANDRSRTQNNTYAPQFNLTLNGASATPATERKVRKWVREAINDTFDDLGRQSGYAMG